MAFQAVIFDMDGTLLDTLADIRRVVNQVLEENGFSGHPLEKYRYFIGNGPRELIVRALPPHARQPETIETCLAAYLEGYEQDADGATRLFPGIGELLDQLTARGVQLAVLTNKRHHLAQGCMELFFNRWSFELVLGLRDHVPPKPDPSAALTIARHLSLAPKACVFVGDSDVDMATAKAAGMHGAGALWGYRTAAELRKAGADDLLVTPLDLLQLL